MAFPIWLTYLAVAFASVLLLLSSHRWRSRRYNLPPGPKSWPVIGNLNLIGALPHLSIHELSKKHGPLMHLWFGSFPVVVGSSVDMARFFLKTHDEFFADRPKMAAGKYTTYNYQDITWSPYGAYWRQARRICLTELFSARRLESYEYIRSEEVCTLLRELYRSAGAVIQPKDFLSIVSLNVISRMVLGKKYLVGNSDGDVSAEEFSWMVNEWFLLNGVLNIGDVIPWLGFLDLQGYVRRMKKLSKNFDRFLEHVLDEHNEQRRSQGERFVATDMVGVLLQLADDPTLKVSINRVGVKAFTQDLLVGGTESSAVTVEWALSELLKHPDTFQKATEELDRVVGRDRLVEEGDILNLPYLESIVKETMRLHPVAPMLGPHQSREDTSINGYDIPARTRVLVNVWTIGRDPTIWDEPDEFQPERFMGNKKKIDVKGHDFELLPFGAGRRMCPGYNLGLKVIQLSLANLLHGFTWKLPDGMEKEDLSMEEVFGLSVPRKVLLEAVVEPKLEAHLYEA